MGQLGGVETQPERFADAVNPGGQGERTDHACQHRRLAGQRGEASHGFQVNVGAPCADFRHTQRFHSRLVGHESPDDRRHLLVGEADCATEGFGLDTQVHAGKQDRCGEPFAQGRLCGHLRCRVGHQLAHRGTGERGARESQDGQRETRGSLEHEPGESAHVGGDW